MTFQTSAFVIKFLVFLSSEAADATCADPHELIMFYFDTSILAIACSKISDNFHGKRQSLSL